MTKNLHRDFRTNIRGNLSITTGVVGVLLLTAVGATLDGGRMFSTHQKLQSITDAAALMATQAEGITPEARKKIAEESIKAHVERSPGLNLSGSTVDVRQSGGQVYVSLEANVPMMFGAVMGSENRRVSVSSTAEESVTSSMSNLSISLVLDLSSSMGGRFDKGSKVASVQAAISDAFTDLTLKYGGDVAAEAQISTGLYPFNWGSVDDETVPLEPGTNTVLSSMSYMSLGEGSVSSNAIERAVADQLMDAEVTGPRSRYLIYITDGKIDEDRSDVNGRYLSKFEMFDAQDTKKCEKVAEKIAKIDKKLEPYLTETSGLASPLGPNNQSQDTSDPGLDLGLGVSGLVAADVSLSNDGLNAAVDVPAAGNRNDENDEDDEDENEDENENENENEDNDNNPGADVTSAQLAQKLKDDKHLGHDHSKDVAKMKAKRVELREEFIEQCMPTQPVRVARACQTARDNDVSIIGINLSGDDGIATNAVDMCVRGIDLPETKRGIRVVKSETKKSKSTLKVLPSGAIIRVSEDGKSLTGDANSLEDIREMIGSMFEEGTTTRSVRLVE